MQSLDETQIPEKAAVEVPVVPEVEKKLFEYVVSIHFGNSMTKFRYRSTEPDLIKAKELLWRQINESNVAAPEVVYINIDFDHYITFDNEDTSKIDEACEIMQTHVLATVMSRIITNG